MPASETKTSAATIWTCPEAGNAAAQRLAAHANDWLWRHIDRPVKLDYDGRIVVADLPLCDSSRADAPQSTRTVLVALKQFRVRSFWKRLLAPLRNCKAMRCWQKADWLRKRGIPTPRPLMASRPRRGDEWGASYLATEWIIGGENLHLYLWRIANDMSGRFRRAGRCAECLGQIVGRMHNAGLGHRDLKAANLLVVENAYELVAYIVDLDGVRRGDLGMEQRAADLARLAVCIDAHPWLGRMTFARFFKAYMKEQGDPIDCRALGRKTMLCAAKMIARKRQTGQKVL